MPAKTAKKAPAKKKVATKALVEKRGPVRPARKPTRRQIEQAIDAHLVGTHATIYGRSFDIRTGEDPRTEAIEFFADFYEAVSGRLK